MAFALLAAEAADHRAAVEKKLLLLDSYFGSSSADKVQASDDPDATDLLGLARVLGSQARQALDGGNVSGAEEAAREALRAFSRATMALSRSTSSSDQLRKRNQALRKEVEGYRQSFVEGARDKGPEATALLDVQLVDALLRRAGAHSAAGRHLDAARALREAHGLTVAAITRLRRNQTVVYSLDFQTPADEYRYELEQHRGYELLVDQLRAAGKAAGSRAKLVDRYVSEGGRMAVRAQDRASRGDFEGAIPVMEEANKSLKRALQMMGVAIPI
jgi:hypothetical protein